MRVVRYHRPPDLHFARCGELPCKSKFKGKLFQPPHPEYDFPGILQTMRRSINVGHGGSPTRATFKNHIGNWPDVSLCVEPQHVPERLTHTGRHREGRILICESCKHQRVMDRSWRKREIATGVCSTCRTWALANL